MTPETKWLLTLLHREPLAPPADPARAIDAVQRQRLSAFVRYRWRQENGCDPSWDAGGILQRSELEGHARRAALDDTLSNALRVADEESLRYLVVKGQAFADLYPDPWLRAQCDLDLLVAPEDFRHLAEALTRGGFAVVGDDPSNPTELVLRDLSNGAQLELHNGFSFDPHVRFDELWSNREELELCGRRVPVLGHLDALILSVLHVAAGHVCRNALSWFIDTLLILERCEDRYPNDLPERLRRRTHEAGWRNDAQRHFDLISSLLRPETADRGAGAAPIDQWAARWSIDQPDTDGVRGFASVWLWERFRQPDTPRFRAKRFGKLFWPTNAECRRRFPHRSRMRRRLAHYGQVARFFAAYLKHEGSGRLRAGLGWGAATGTAVAVATLRPSAFGWLVLPAFVPVFLFLSRRRNGFERLGLTIGVVLPWAAASLGGFFPVLVWSLGINPVVAVALMALMGLVGIAWLYFTLAPYEWLRSRAWVPALCAPLLIGVWFGLTEWLRGWVTAPWSELGYPLIGIPLLALPARWITLNGLSAVATALSGFGALALSGSASRKRRVAAALIGATLLTAWLGNNRIAGPPEPSGAREPLEILIVQPGFPTGDKYDPVKAAQQVQRLIELTAAELSQRQSIKLVIWPESAINFNYTTPLDAELEELLEGLREALRPYPDVHLLTGIVRRPDDQDRFNAALLFNSRLELMGHYDRRTLIPIGEYTPLYLPRAFGRPGIRSSPFAAGPDAQGVLQLGDYRLGVLICHEGLFAGYAREYEALGADLVINIGNDEIFRSERNPGLAMHINHTRFRAIESATPVVRVFNSGPSGLLLPDGSYESLLPFEVGVAHTALVRLR